MELKELLENWIVDIVSSALGIVLIYFAYDIRATNAYYWIPLLSGILFQVPTIYFQIWRYIFKVKRSN